MLNLNYKCVKKNYKYIYKKSLYLMYAATHIPSENT